MAGTPRVVSPGFVRVAIATWHAINDAATVAADFAANTLVTIFGGTAGFNSGIWVEIEKLRLIVTGTDFVGGGGTLTFVLRKGSATGTALATLTFVTADAIRGAVLEASVAAAADADAKLRPGDLLFITRTATGTAFTTGQGTWQIIGRQRLQSRGA